MVRYLHNRVVASGWTPPESARSHDDCLGVLLRRSRGNYVTAPDTVHHALLGAVMRLNLSVAITLQPQLLDGVLRSLTPGQTELKFKDGSQVQIIDSLTFAHSATVKKFQYACICRQERLVLVWHDDLQNIVPVATQMEEKLLSLVGLTLGGRYSSQANTRTRSGAKVGCRSTFFRCPAERPPSCHRACPVRMAIQPRHWKRQHPCHTSTRARRSSTETPGWTAPSLSPDL